MVWTELLLFVQHAEAEHAAWVDTCHALRHLDWSQQLNTTMTALSDCAPTLETESQLLLGSLMCCKAKKIPLHFLYLFVVSCLDTQAASRST